MAGKTFAAIFLALPAAVALTGLLALLGPGSMQARTLPVLLLFFPLWIAAISASFAFGNGKQAILWMGTVSFLGCATLYAAKALQWVALPA